MKWKNVSALCLLMSPWTLLANPQSHSVVAGDASCQIHSPELLEIVASDRSIIEWENFSIQEGEITRFIQPDASSAVLNRVIMENPSHILGRLESNGQVLLINPYGILFGKEARIDVGSLVASTFDIHDSAFLENQELRFAGASQEKILHEGVIHARSGDALLIAQEIHCPGSISATDGQTAVMALTKVSLTPQKKGAFFIKSKADEVGDHLFSTAFTHPTVRVEGNLSSQSTDGRGGNIKVLGDWVVLENSARMDASGNLSGGEILIGGDKQGKSDYLASAQNVFVGQSVTIDASAKIDGSGGKVIVWGDEISMFHGTILATGGINSGDGGFVEVSAKNLMYTGFSDLRATNGKTGDLLLDPTDITISAAAQCGTVAFGAGPQPPGCAAAGSTTWTLACGNPVSINNANLVTALNAANVTLDTSQSVDMGAAGNILVTAPVVWPTVVANPAHTLTLKASNSITINNNVQEQSTVNPSGGGVVLVTLADSPASITINNPLGSGNTTLSVGSRNGTTMIGDPCVSRCNRTRPDVTISDQNNGFTTRLGFGISNTVTATGPIDVTCGSLLIGGSHGGSLIGHGEDGVANAVNAIITVDVLNNIHIQGANTNGGGVSYYSIGHGSRFSSAGSSLKGDICVTTEKGNILMDVINGDSNNLVIGHGSANNGGIAATLTGNIVVSAPAGTITLTATNNTHLTIGHFCPEVFAVSPTTNPTGDIIVASGGAISLTGAGTCSSVIGHFSINNELTSTPFPQITSNISVATNGDINLGPANYAGIGALVTAPNTPSSVSVIAGGTLTITGGGGPFSSAI